MSCTYVRKCSACTGTGSQKLEYRQVQTGETTITDAGLSVTCPACNGLGLMIFTGEKAEIASSAAAMDELGETIARSN